jgi:hypothetical protein
LSRATLAFSRQISPRLKYSTTRRWPIWPTGPKPRLAYINNPSPAPPTTLSHRRHTPSRRRPNSPLSPSTRHPQLSSVSLNPPPTLLSHSFPQLGAVAHLVQPPPRTAPLLPLSVLPLGLAERSGGGARCVGRDPGRSSSLGVVRWIHVWRWRRSSSLGAVTPDPCVVVAAEALPWRGGNGPMRGGGRGARGGLRSASTTRFPPLSQLSLISLLSVSSCRWPRR